MKKIEEFLEWLKSSSDSELTQKAYRNNLYQFYDIMNINDSNLDTFNTKEFLMYTNKLKETYAPTSVNQKIGTVRSYYKYLWKAQEIKDERYKAFEPMKLGRKLPEFLEFEDAIQLLNTVRSLDINPKKTKGKLNLRDRLIIEIFLDTGVRGFELVNMKISDINFNDGETFIFGKGKVQRYVKMSDSTLDLIKKWLEVRKELNIKEGFEDYLLISSTNGENLKKRRIQYIIQKYVDVSGVEQVSMHKLRHTYASLMVSTGKMSEKELQDRMGHKRKETTDLYVHALRRKQGGNPLFA